MFVPGLVVVIAALGAGAKTPPPAGDTRSFTMIDEFATAIWPEKHPRFVASTADERDAVRLLLPQMLEAARASRAADPAWKALAARASMKVETWTFSGETFLALVEEETKRHGSGAYVLRVGKAADREILLEAPHVFFDMETDTIGLRIFLDPPDGAARPRAFFTNTVHRYQDSKDKSVRKNNPADVCHNADHLFHVATVALASAIGNARVIQLHGFADAADEDGNRPPEGATMVVSGGRKDRATPLAKATASALVKGFDRGVKLYPDESKALGATTNVQGNALASMEHAEFLHLEMSKSLRDALASDPERVRALAKVLLTN